MKGKLAQTMLVTNTETPVRPARQDPPNKRPIDARESCRQPAEVAQTAGLNCLFFVRSVASTAVSKKPM